MAIRGGPDIIEDGLVLHLDAADRNSYPGTGTTWYDLSGNGYNANVVNAPSFVDIKGGAFLFDGTNDYFLASDPGSLNNFSVECWFYNTGGSSGYKCILASVYGTRVNFTIHCPTTNQITYGIYNGGWANWNLNVAGGWQNVVFTYDGNNAKLYNNGSLVHSATSGNKVAESNGLGIRIGRRWDLGDYYGGYIQAIKIYNRTMTADEVLQNHNSFKGRFGL